MATLRGSFLSQHVDDGTNRQGEGSGGSLGDHVKTGHRDWPKT